MCGASVVRVLSMLLFVSAPQQCGGSLYAAVPYLSLAIVVCCVSTQNIANISSNKKNKDYYHAVLLAGFSCQPKAARGSARPLSHGSARPPSHGSAQSQN